MDTTRPSRQSVLGCLAALVAVAGPVGCDDGARGSASPSTQPSASASSFPVLANRGKLTISYPAAKTHFPLDIIAPTIAWKDGTAGVVQWQADIVVGGRSLASAKLDQPTWRPNPAQWRAVKQAAKGSSARISIEGRAGPATAALSRTSVPIHVSKDVVGAPILYRDVIIPFAEAREHLEKIRWRLGRVDTREPSQVVMENLAVCGNCHSVSPNGKYLGMNIDFAPHRGNFTVSPIGETVKVDESTTFRWVDYKPDDPEYRTAAFLHTFSPDGRYVITTADDRSTLIRGGPLEYSFSAFFTFQGILVVYDTQEKKFWPLPGADDREYVQTNAAFSPDGKTVVFARAKALAAPKQRAGAKSPYAGDLRAVAAMTDDMKKALKERGGFRYDLYKVPFNGGKGGTATPIAGASDNGKSNYFPKISPDGKWLVFTQAKSFNLLQPDSRLFIVSMAGGKSRDMTCNTSNMNSWHSWSPNSRWLVFSSKSHSPYTQLLLTHVDEQGRDTPPVLLENLVLDKRAANIPEFANIKPEQLKRIVPPAYERKEPPATDPKSDAAAGVKRQ